MATPLTSSTTSAVRASLACVYLGIDTPETKKPGYTVGCWGPEATQFAESTLTGQRVALSQ